MTAAVIGHGLHAHPAIVAVKDMIKSWVKLWAHCDKDRVRLAWRACYAKVVEAGKPQWKQARGHIAATILTLQQYGWNVAFC